MVNKIFAKNIKSPESNDLSGRFVGLESAYSNTISDVAIGASHFLLSLPIFYIWDVYDTRHIVLKLSF